MSFRNILFLVSICFFDRIGAMGGSAGREDPFALTNYMRAFDQAEIHKKFYDLMKKLGCDKNVFDTATFASLPKEAVAVEVQEDFGMPDVIGTDGPGEEQARLISTLAVASEPLKDEIIKYEKACLAKLGSVRRWAVTEDAREAGTTLGLVGGGAGATNLILPAESMGGSFSVFALFMNAAYMAQPISRSIYHWLRPPAHPLDRYERKFATMQCFIPRELWPIITEKFMSARINKFDQRNAIDFIEFALGLTTYKPRPALKIDSDMLPAKMDRLFGKIDTFFDDYQGHSAESVWMLKDNIYKFIMSLKGDGGQLPRYVYLHGVGGIGKTHLVNKICEWIQELIPDGVQFEDIVINSPEDLEGSSGRPGAMLRVLRNQLMHAKRGSIVFMDEATWLNKDHMISSAKRVFNGDQSRISTDYFGAGIEGTGVKLAVPPMLIFVASNEEIKDPALKTRFDSIDFPLPKKDRLIGFAREVAAESQLLSDRVGKLEGSGFDFDTWVGETKIKNFRDITSGIVPAILAAKLQRK